MTGIMALSQPSASRRAGLIAGLASVAVAGLAGRAGATAKPQPETKEQSQ
jgi:hypothetical protein